MVCIFSDLPVLAILFGIREMKNVPFLTGLELRDIPQTVEDREFALEDLVMGLMAAVYEEVG